MKSKIKLLAIALALVAAAPTALAASPRTEYRPYNVALGLWAVCPNDASPEVLTPSVGGVCFVLDSSETTATVIIHDASLQSGVPFEWAFDTPFAAKVSFGYACDSTAALPVPFGASVLRAWVGVGIIPFAAQAGVTCTPGLATTGSVQVNFA
jgi:hypothetical protein